MTLSPEAAAAGREALGKVDTALAARPDRDDHTLSDATQALCALRDGLIAEAAGGAPDGAERERLETVNAVLGVVLGVHFPIGPTPWEDLQAARGWLAGLLDAVSPPHPGPG